MPSGKKMPLASKPRKTENSSKQIPQIQNQQLQKVEKPPSWAVVRGLLPCRYLQTVQQPEEKQQIKNKQQQEQKKKQKLKQQQQEEQEQNHKVKQLLQDQEQMQKVKKQQQEQALEETDKKCKKMKCSGSLCSNTKVMHRPEIGTPEVHKKRALMGSSSNNEASSSRSIKSSLHELNGVVSATTSFSASSNSSSVGGSLRGMPFRRFSGCYECKMVVDPVLGFARDPSLRSSICSCPQCGEIFMKPENLELHQAVRHAGITLFFKFSHPPIFAI